MLTRLFLFPFFKKLLVSLCMHTHTHILKYKEIEVQKIFCNEVFLRAYLLSRFSHVQLFAILWTVTHKVPLSNGFSRQEDWSRMPRPPTGDLPTQGSNPHLLHLLHWQAASLPLMPTRKPHFSLSLL